MLHIWLQLTLQYFLEVLFALIFDLTLSGYFLNCFRLIIGLRGRISSLGLYWNCRIWAGINYSSELKLAEHLHKGWCIDLEVSNYWKLSFIRPHCCYLASLLLPGSTHCTFQVWNKLTMYTFGSILLV